ncbi:MAG: proteasome subunit beta [Actinomycetota bacterium]
MRDDPLFPPVAAGDQIGANPSFFDLVVRTRPELVKRGDVVASGPGAVPMPGGTTILGLKYAGGVVFAGDRRATEGYTIADDRMEKVFAADDYSVIGIAGVAGQAVEIVKLFQLELEHYEKITGDRLSLEGKANRLAQMIRGNFPLALQGLVVVPLFGGYDERRGEGRIFYYDATGGRWEEEDYHATGSGGRPATSSLKKRWRPGLSRDEAVKVAVEALLDAAEEDVATGGPDPTRGIFPNVLVVTAEGVVEASDVELNAAYTAVVAERTGAPAGPDAAGRS